MCTSLADLKKECETYVKNVKHYRILETDDEEIPVVERKIIDNVKRICDALADEKIRDDICREEMERREGIALEGSISAGKSTASAALVELADKLNVPIKLWEEQGFEGWIVDVQHNAKRAAYPCQVAMLFSCFRAFHVASYDNIFRKVQTLNDRTPLGNTIFSEAHHGYGNISDDEFTRYWTEYARWESEMLEPIQGAEAVTGTDKRAWAYNPTIAFLHRSADRCHHTATQGRCRAGETSLPLDYFRTIERIYIATFVSHLIDETKKSKFNVMFMDWQNWGTPEDILVNIFLWRYLRPILEVHTGALNSNTCTLQKPLAKMSSAKRTDFVSRFYPINVLQSKCTVSIADIARHAGDDNAPDTPVAMLKAESPSAASDASLVNVAEE